MGETGPRASPLPAGWSVGLAAPHRVLLHHFSRRGHLFQLSSAMLRGGHGPSTGRTQQRHQEHNHQRQDLHIHFCTPLWLSASHSLIYCSGVCVCVWMRGRERRRERAAEQGRGRESVCSPVYVRSECVNLWECAWWLSDCACVLV